MNAQPKTPGDLFQRQQTGVLLDPKLVKLIQLVPDAAGLRRPFLRPPAGLPQLPQPLPEPD